MPRLEEIVERYQKYSDEELLDVYSKIDEYSDEGKEALKIVLKSKGGIDNVKKRIAKQLEIDKEVERIRAEIKELLIQGRNTIQINENIAINNITKTQLEEIIKEVSAELEFDKSDKQIKPRTIIGSIIGGFIGGTIGGIIWGVQMVHSNHIFLILGIGLAMISYAFVRLFTQQSKKNIIVLVMTVVSVIYALILGQLIFEAFGYVGK